MGSTQLDEMETESPTEIVESIDDEDVTEEDISFREVQEEKEVEESDAVSFFPPAYLQRYCRVREVLFSLLELPKYKYLNSTTGKTVMEVGCAEFRMMSHFKSLLDITKIIFVDLDEQLMVDKLHFLRPLPAEYLQRTSRPQPLVVEAYAGCVTKVDPELRRENPNIWAVVGIEIVEHLHADVLRGFEESVFGIISPQIVIVTTPNSDFNEVFKLPPGKFRHWDHKFEWSRKEFQMWCNKIICEFKNYSYRIEGICEGPEETRHLGCVSQMAVFEKNENARNDEDISQFTSRIQSNTYKLLQTTKFPNFIETRSPERIILDEFQYFVVNYVFGRSMLGEYEEMETKEVKVPLLQIMTIGEIGRVSSGNLTFLRDVLEKGGYKTVSENDEVSVVMNVDEYLAANAVDNSSESDHEDPLQSELCQDMRDLDVNRIIEPDEDEWE